MSRDLTGWTRVDGLQMMRDQVIDLYQWMLEDDNFERVYLHTDGEFTPERARAAIEQWKTHKPDAIVRHSLSFKDDADAVLVKMRFT